MWPQQATGLRPLGVGERIDAAIKIVRASFLTFAKAGLVLAIPFGVFEVLVNQTITTSASSIVTKGPAGQPVFHATNLSTIFGAAFVEVVVGYLITAVSTAVSFRIVANTYLGLPTDWREALRYGFRKFGSVMWIQFLVALAGGIGMFLLALVVILVVVGLVSAHVTGLAVVAGFLLGAAALCAFVWFTISASLGVPVMMLEDLRGVRAIRRSFSLCRKFWWSAF